MDAKLPDSINIHLPCYLNYKTSYVYMVDDLKSVNDEPVSYSQFCKMMLTDFPEVTTLEGIALLPVKHFTINVM